MTDAPLPIAAPRPGIDPWAEPPLGLLAELTHRCPLQCPYCSNPLGLDKSRDELTSATWQRVLEEAVALGVLQLHLSGGEPATRKDLEAIIARARDLGLYTNLITSGVTIDRARLTSLRAAGLDHVQLSLQGLTAAVADRVAGYRNGHARKLALAREVRAQGLPLTVNAVVHRQNLHELEGLIELAVSLDAQRIEVAHVQYYGWALLNRAALMPTRAQLDAATATVEAARERHRGRLQIDYVIPDYWAKEPKPCMGGWGRTVINVSPAGRVMPCHAAATIPGLELPSVMDHSLRWIWQESPAFQRFRGLDWMPEPCRSCEKKEADFGGCRCQAMALTGDPHATDPACALSPHHTRLTELALAESAAPPPAFTYRRPMQELPVLQQTRLAPA